MQRKSRGPCQTHLCGRILIFVGMWLAVSGVTTPASAQMDPLRALFPSFFSVEPKPSAPQPVQPAPERPKRVEPPEPKIVEQPKNQDAQAVLVIGDAQAGEIASGLQMAFADTPSIVIVDKSRKGSSLITDPVDDPVARLNGILADRKFDFIVVMMGENDRATFPASLTGGKVEETRSEKWEAIYRDRVARLDLALKGSGKPFFWVGLPPMERPSLSAFASYLNGIYKSMAEQAGGTSVDSWNGFVDEDGHFDYEGPDVDGQMKRLRSFDGTHFTRAGQRKLAFYVETEIRKLMRGETSRSEVVVPEVLSAQPKGQAAMLAAPPPLPPAPWDRIGPVMPLGGQTTGDTDLAGGAPTRSLADAKLATNAPQQMPGGFPFADTPLYARIIKGEPIAPQNGRVDDFAWKR